MESYMRVEGVVECLWLPSGVLQLLASCCRWLCEMPLPGPAAAACFQHSKYSQELMWVQDPCRQLYIFLPLQLLTTLVRDIQLLKLQETS
jgi:hypothetical protein